MLLSIYPFYYMFVIATRSLDAINDVPPPFTPGGAFGDNFQRVLDNDAANFLKGLVNSLIVSHAWSPSAWCSSARWPASPSPSCGSGAATRCCWPSSSR